MRLPTQSELLLLKGDPATDLGMSGYFWSSEQGGANFAYHVGLPDGGQINRIKGYNYVDVRCVR
jgi:hypothetical protein